MTHILGDRNNQNGDDSALTFGTCRVSIPAHHITGNLEGPFWGFSPNPAKHVTILSLTINESEFATLLDSSLDNSVVPEALVFIHGYDVGFNEAARRAVQLTWDLQFQGVPILYSWPSADSPLKYTNDESAAEWAVPHLERFLRIVAQRSGARKIHIIAHSLGNRALVKAL
jgi:esterase/lipase superfamily enzyme